MRQSTLPRPADECALLALAQRADVGTYEFENVPVRTVHYLSKHVTVLPPAAALAAAQDRLSEKRLFRDLGIPTPAFASVESLRDLEEAAAESGFPAVLKTRTHGSTSSRYCNRLPVTCGS